jgi:hypothetical protein
MNVENVVITLDMGYVSRMRAGQGNVQVLLAPPFYTTCAFTALSSEEHLPRIFNIIANFD